MEREEEDGEKEEDIRDMEEEDTMEEKMKRRRNAHHAHVGTKLNTAENHGDQEGHLEAGSGDITQHQEMVQKSMKDHRGHGDTMVVHSVNHQHPLVMLQHQLMVQK